MKNMQEIEITQEEAKDIIIKNLEYHLDGLSAIRKVLILDFISNSEGIPKYETDPSIDCFISPIAFETENQQVHEAIALLQNKAPDLVKLYPDVKAIKIELGKNKRFDILKELELILPTK